MYFIEVSKQIWRDIKRHKLRTFLATLGIVWGIFTLITLLAFGDGFIQANKTSMKLLTENALMAFPQGTDKSFQGIGQRRMLYIQAHDVLQLPKALPLIQHISPYLSNSFKLSAARRLAYPTINGVNADLNAIKQYPIQHLGRFLNPLDIRTHAKVIFLGNKLATQLFPHTPNPVLRHVLLNNIPFTIIGVLSPQNRISSYKWDDRKAYIPYTTYLDLTGRQKISLLYLSAKHAQDIPTIKRQLYQYFSKKLHFSPKDKSSIWFLDLSQASAFFNAFFFGVKLFLALVAILTLCVGGLGVANMMYVIVSERRGEFGLRLAVGATDRDITYLVLFESLFLTLLGSIVGIALALMLIHALNIIPLPAWLGHPHLIPLSLLISFFSLIIIGLGAGYFPARQAAKLNPTETLRSL